MASACWTIGIDGNVRFHPMNELILDAKQNVSLEDTVMEGISSGGSLKRFIGRGKIVLIFKAFLSFLSGFLGREDTVIQRRRRGASGHGLALCGYFETEFSTVSHITDRNCLGIH